MWHEHSPYKNVKVVTRLVQPCDKLVFETCNNLVIILKLTPYMAYVGGLHFYPTEAIHQRIKVCNIVVIASVYILPQ